MRGYNLVIVGIPLLMLGGCAPPRSPSVFVDLEAVLADEAPLADFSIVEPRPPAPPSGVAAMVQPGLPPRLLRAQTRERMEQARQLVEENRRQAYQVLLRRLREVYREEALLIHEERLEAVRGFRDELLEEALGRYREIFEVYAAERGPLLARLALHAGVPDRDPLSTRVHVGDDLHLRAKLEEAKEIRAHLARQLEEFSAQATRLFESADEQVGARLERLRVELEALRRAADVRAEEEAAQQLRRHEEEVRIILADRDEIRLPEVPQRSFTGSPTPPPLPSLPPLVPERLMDTREDRRRAVEGELRIWLTTHGYRRAATRAGFRDATEEFREWRRTHRPGP
jgi:hypothetical protein